MRFYDIPKKLFNEFRSGEETMTNKWSRTPVTIPNHPKAEMVLDPIGSHQIRLRIYQDGWDEAGRTDSRPTLEITLTSDLNGLWFEGRILELERQEPCATILNQARVYYARALAAEKEDFLALVR